MFYNDYVSISDQKYMAFKSTKKLEKKLNRSLEAIILPNSKLALTWWGKMWNVNLERYAEYENRLSRGKTYVKNGLVIDLQITEGHVSAYVQGKRKEPYHINIDIEPTKSHIINKIKEKCQGKLDTIEELIDGQFSKEIAEIFMFQGIGLFPEPKEIKFRCSCPDWTSCCKHVSATFYGIGSKLDSNPLLFFTLRGIDIDDFTKDVIVSKTKSVLEKGINCQSKRIIKDADIDYLFDIKVEK